MSPTSVDEKLTDSAGRRCPSASVTVAVAVVDELPSAMIDDGAKATVIFAGGPAVWVSGAVADKDPSVAVIVGVPTVVDEVMVAV